MGSENQSLSSTQPPLLDLPHQQSRLSLWPSRCSAQVPQERSTPSQGLRFLDNYLPSDPRSRPPSCSPPESLLPSSSRAYDAIPHRRVSQKTKFRDGNGPVEELRQGHRCIK